jgi:exodeoxyribonuclease-1
MALSFYFYDLETSGFNARDARIMQFAGQRTDMDLKPVGEPHNFLIKMTDDVVPEPDAILITGITPQKTIQEGLTEAEFLKIFSDEIALPETIFLGFNSVRFDDEFMRFMLYRNFYDAYEWQWNEGRSRWDLLDLVRMTRALRPEGIKWPVDSSGAPTNRLELLASINSLDHQNAHDALSDVMATISVAQMIRSKQPKLFDYLLKMRDKKKVEQLAMSGQPFIYSSGKYASEFEKTTVVATVCEHPSQSGGALVFDLRYDPEPFAKLSHSELVDAWRKRKDDPGLRLPVKTLKYNRCPAVAQLNVLDEASQKRLKLDPEKFQENFTKLEKVQDELCIKLKQAVEFLDKKQQAKLLEDEQEVDARLYENFFSQHDKTQMSIIRAASHQEIGSLDLDFKDERLQSLLPLYRARNFPDSLTDDDRATWETFRQRKLLGGGNASRLAKFFLRLGELSERTDLTGEQRYLLEELQLYGQSIMPEQD